jgi:hypothetical protein
MSNLRILLAALVTLALTAPAAAAPSVVSTTPIDVGPTSVRLAIGLGTSGFPGTFHVEYGETTAYGAQTPDADVAGRGGETQVTARITGLTAATGYHYRAVLTTREGTVNGPDQTVTTSDVGAPALTHRPFVALPAGGTGFLCEPGTWGPTTSFAYQWLRDLQPIAGATAQGYQPVVEDDGHALACRVTASDTDKSSFATSDGLQVVPRPVPLLRPSIVTPPGSAYSGAAIVCDPGRWSAASAFIYGWVRDGQPIPGAERSVYTVTPEDEGRTLTCRVVAVGTSGTSADAFSDPLSVLNAGAACVGCATTATALPSSAAVAVSIRSLARAFAVRKARSRLLRRGALRVPFTIGHPGVVLVEWQLGGRSGGVVLARATVKLTRNVAAPVRLKLVRGARDVLRRSRRQPLYAVATFGPTVEGSYTIAQRVRR